jgi:hypothetical protein
LLKLSRFSLRTEIDSYTDSHYLSKRKNILSKNMELTLNHSELLAAQAGAEVFLGHCGVPQNDKIRDKL